MRGDRERGVRFGHDLRQIQDENGVDLALLQSNQGLSVEQRLVALEEYVRFVDALSQTALQS